MKLNSNSDESKSISSLTEASPNSLKKAFNKITVQNILNENNESPLNYGDANKPNTIIRKIKDFGVIGSVNNANGIMLSSIHTRKFPLQENKIHCDTNETNNTIETNCPLSRTAINKKLKLTKEEKAVLKETKKLAKENSIPFTKIENSTNDLRNIIKRQNGHGRKGLSMPQAVARRNARERNRVKQVNNGFAALRERIPDEVAKAFETNNNNGRSSSKKFSKVETLRMAVEYIRSLERLLGIDFSNHNNGNQSQSSGDDSFILIKDEFDVLSPFPNDILDDALIQCDDDSYINGNETLTTNEDVQTTSCTSLPNISVLNGLQYIRIPDTNTYQLLSSENVSNTNYSTNNSNIDERSQLFKILMDKNSLNPINRASSTLSSSTTINMINVMPNTKAMASPTALALNDHEYFNEDTRSPTNNLLITPVPKTPSSKASTTSSALSLKTAVSSSTLTLCTNTTSLLQQPITTTTIIRRQSSELSPVSNTELDLKQECVKISQMPQQQQIIIYTETMAQTNTKSQLHNEKEFKNSTKGNEICAIEKHLQQTPQYLTQEQKQFLESLSMSTLLEKQPASINTTAAATICGDSQLSTFFNNEALENSQQFYTDEDLILKKEFDNVILESSDANVALSDENIIDWWQSHAYKSDDTTLV